MGNRYLVGKVKPPKNKRVLGYDALERKWAFITYVDGSFLTDSGQRLAAIHFTHWEMHRRIRRQKRLREKQFPTRNCRS